ncbi:MAG: 5-amino-6-(D-ribitylamino)uracil--L-tyrosine 4-hydroxyphenyl transferase CofH [Methanothrix sp.]|nr:5-amino-6-(D-ribitylamino)uracil--L-tyrosine 4-hydroxyphenyl transferase CofH [Methanothrix sp.]HOI68204.1 5-amino-6-(D-ribitylamino)uracil--L-tyrosine 4-hydroxyphenyl transferase CofH [Methanothrix sp.]HPY72019.1 5-amino-6-(D-ribitylamino)uracil--L-tyrosine 4-hydroxyphenyl transferase CofH [Methanothrix sp.]HQA61898.1 5-amino-6-(D-ribitylamino)uracil--L-tyrosine 4-hydroxyphenyl transferase CofH [Methanothrix sp.]
MVRKASSEDSVSCRDGWLDPASLLSLYCEPLKLFRLANLLREERCGDEVSYVINRNINFTNRCVGNCSFCAFRRADGYLLTEEEILGRVEAAERLSATEICLQGGLAPGLVLEDYCRILEAIKEDYPRMHLHAYSPMEVFYMSKSSGTTPAESIRELQRAGLGSMPGTAAEILVDRIREEICPSKLSTDQWRYIVTTAHRLGVPTTSTILYGHVERLEDRIAHLHLLREIQAETGGFTEFVLLPFMPKNNPLGGRARRMGVLENLKMHALARVALHPLIPNIQASWVKLGRDLAGRTTWWGTNDLGGTLMEENISRTAGATEEEGITPQELCDLIERNGRVPIQRTTLYGRVK